MKLQRDTPVRKQFKWDASDGEDFRRAAEDLKGQIAQLVSEREASGLSSSDKAKITRQITPLKKQLDLLKSLLADCPPPPVDPSDAIAEVRDWIAGAKERHAAVVEKVMRGVDSCGSLGGAMRVWFDTVAEADHVLHLVKKVEVQLDQIPQDLAPFEMFAMMLVVVDREWARIADRWLSDVGISGGDPMGHMERVAKHNAGKDFLGDLEWRLFSWEAHLLPGIESWRELNAD